ncbi:unnamed protein product [marine sediment metagenome]|uniref:Uncharacterized protein n=1 Tax=marine sediment metagenome TaxID=412755 RepID=X1FW53_9ZZZZ
MALVAAFLGTWRIVHKDANDNMVAELLEKLTSEFGIVAADSAVLTNPEQMPKVKKGLSTILREDDKLYVMTKFGADDTMDDDTVIWHIRIPITFRNKRTGVVYEKTLYDGDFTHLWAESTGTAAKEAGIWYDALRYTVPAQSEVKLGHAIQDVRVDGALNLAMDTDSA